MRHDDTALEELLKLARDLHSQGRFDEAAARYESVLAAAPEHADALHFFGVLQAQRGQLEPALELLARATQQAPFNAGALYNYANTLCEAGRLSDALANFDRALAIRPTEPAILNNRGAVLHDLKRHEDAVASYDRALALQPRHASALNNRGNSLLALKKYEDALASYGRSLSFEPRSPNAQFGSGKALIALSRWEEALERFTRACALAPHHAEAHAHCGHVLFHLGKYGDALAAYEQAVAILPELASAHRGRGDALFKLRRGEEAFAAYDRAFAIDPKLDYIEGTRFLSKMYVCNWSQLDSEREHLVTRVLEGEPAVRPFEFLMAAASPREQLACARAFSAAEYPESPAPLWRGERYRHEKIRIGYMSGEFREQATAYLVADLFECHDRDRFALHAFSMGGNDRSPMRHRIEEAFDVFADVPGETDRAIAERIRRAEIDILVNLNGYFGEERTSVCALRPSPIQINYLGFPGTMGAPYMDYILADRWLVPEHDQAFYSEKIVYLPDSYQANDRKKAIGEGAVSRAECGLPENGFVFCSFNNAYKITPEMFSIWMRLLREVHGSVLWLLKLDPATERNLRKEAEARGVAAERLVFAPFLKLADHLARGRLADLFLDTLPVNAHTTASDALWMGVPVLTCLGATFAGRVAASLLSAVGLEELIARSLADYEALALTLARDPAKLTGLRTKLARHREIFPLFDTPRLARHIESAYLRMHERHQRGLPPEGFAVEEA